MITSARRLAMYARFGWGLPAYLRFRITPEEARAEIRRRLAEREESFLKVVERGVFGNSKSPYRALFELAGCELGDLRQMVLSKGLEPTLGILKESGLYVTYEEFKGRAPLVRGGREIPVAPGDFDNPFLAVAYEQSTGGTTGAAARVKLDFDSLRAKAPRRVLAAELQGEGKAPLGLWRGVLPANGLGAILSRLAAGQVVERWFSPVTASDLRPSLESRLATAYILGMSRLCGVPLPRPEPIRLEEASRIARWVARSVEERGGCELRAYVSLLVRVAHAAVEEGLDLTGAVLGGGGEPPTPAKVEQIRRSGARYLSAYHISELGQVGTPCLRELEINDHHFCQDHLALIQRRRKVPGTEIEVDAFLFTTLLPSAPKLAINVESDDFGIVEERSCGCPWEAEGFPIHIRRIRSFSKLTGEGMTLVGSEALHILEEVLPARFGGSPTDYQLLEEEDQAGLTRLSLVVSPRVEIPSEGAVLEVFYSSLGQGSPAADLARATWAQAGTLRIQRREPIWTGHGKLMPLQTAASRRP